MMVPDRAARMTAVLWQWMREDVTLGLRSALLTGVAGSWLMPRILRYVLFRAAGVNTHSPNVFPGMRIVGPPRNLTIGERNCFNAQVYLECVGPITIGDDCLIGMQTIVLTSDHPPQPDGRPQLDPLAGQVVIGDRVWLGARTLVVPNVAIGDDVVVAAGSVVTRDCAAGGLYAGTPARRIRDLASRQAVRQ
jgi:acetyltransferase-like isoleucine patch superfamily enzyme